MLTTPNHYFHFVLISHIQPNFLVFNSTTYPDLLTQLIDQHYATSLKQVKDLSSQSFQKNLQAEISSITHYYFEDFQLNLKRLHSMTLSYLNLMWKVMCIHLLSYCFIVIHDLKLDELPYQVSLLFSIRLFLKPLYDCRLQILFQNTHLTCWLLKVIFDFHLFLFSQDFTSLKFELLFTFKMICSLLYFTGSILDHVSCY